MQTGDSFVEFLRYLRLQIDARNVALISAGHEAIKLPVIYLGDNHGSRFHETVLKLTDPDDPAFIGILLDFEESNTSQMLQMWDQINKAAHAAYNKGKDEYKKQYKSKCCVPPDSMTACAALHQRLGQAELAIEVSFDDVLALLADTLGLLLVRSLQLARGIVRVEALKPRVAQVAAFEGKPLLSGRQWGDRALGALRLAMR